jgi:3-dehydroquinate synthase
MATATLDISFERSRENCTLTIENKILSRLASHRRSFVGASSLVIITDDVVASLHAEKVRNQLSRIAKTSVIVFPHGEKSKTLDTSSKIASKMSALGLDRRSLAVALGGGVVGDMVGFISSIFKRGIAYVQAPTTLLAQVDSSIGGKTGVDTDWGKNQLGSFYQPRAILVDPSMLDSLPHSEVINGLGEMVKSGIILDRDLFSSIEKLGSFEIKNLKPLITRTCRIKAQVVEKDEREDNLRSILNYGHTVGHAIEASTNFKLGHGKCVVLGMIAEGWIAWKLGLFDRSDLERQNDLLRKITNSFDVNPRFDSGKILKFARLDKKSSRTSINMVLPQAIGKMHKKDGSYLHSVSKNLFLESLRALRREL